MPSETGVNAAAITAAAAHDASHLIETVAAVTGLWYIFILLVQSIGVVQLFRYYSSKPAPAVSAKLPLNDVPHVTIIRPVKGLEPQLYECLSSTFLQTYPRERLTIFFCVSTRSDPALPVLQRLVHDFRHFDVTLLVEEEDPNLSGRNGESKNLGPNPKIRNMSRAYREAKGEVIWIIDCNIWVGKGVAGRMVDKLYGFREGGQRATPYKFIHQLPLVVDSVGAEAQGLLSSSPSNGLQVSSTSSQAYDISQVPRDESRLEAIFRKGGGRLEEMFMASSHAKFYTAINTVSVAPCIVGKSNMFRRAHLDHLTADDARYAPGIDYFSDNICEDHLIGDLLWRSKQPAPAQSARDARLRKHGLVFGDLAIQPMAGMSVAEYAARRVRWLRVRKWTVTAATLVEPGVESLLCSAYGAFALTALPWLRDACGLPHGWPAFLGFWLAGMVAWAALDHVVYAKLHAVASVELDADTPSFARPPGGSARRPFGEWILAWLGRELLALPIWLCAWAGSTVTWRAKTFRVGMDMKVHEITDSKVACSSSDIVNGNMNGHKARKD